VTAPLEIRDVRDEERDRALRLIYDPPGPEAHGIAGSEERAVYVVDGGISMAGQSIDAGTMAVVGDDSDVTLTAGRPSKVMLLGGATIDGDRTIWWNFVSSSKERLEQAKRDWREKRFDDVPGESEFIPLPES